MGVIKMNEKKIKAKKIDRIRKIWFYLTCWRPITKYEHRIMWEWFMKFAQAVDKDHIVFIRDIDELQRKIGIDKKSKDNENIERGMYG